jgi:hypothetical protein
MALAQEFTVEFELSKMACFSAIPQLKLNNSLVKLATFVWLTICDGPTDRTAVLRLARQAVARFPVLEPEVRRFLADQLRTAEPSDLRRQQGAIDRAVGRMVLQSIIAEPDGVL